ncbi:MAG: hypothetical protein HC792_03740 [Acaryochloridaceae cyanobacterium CSU_5_19]|nr:hypothetical protein [Acaryochloridaceae cyanobacterium CSU_5_19]
MTTLEATRCLVLDHVGLQAAINCYPDIKPVLMAGLYSRQQSLKVHSWRKSVVQEWFAKTQEHCWAY